MDLASQLASLADESIVTPKQEKVACVVYRADYASETTTVVAMAGSTDWENAVKGAPGKMREKKKAPSGEQFNSPTVVPLTAKVRCLSVGPCSGHILFVCDEGMYGMGLNLNGQLGLGSTGVVRTPTKLPLWGHIGRVMAAAAGKNHSLVCFEGGVAATCGSGSRGALGHGERKAELNDVWKPQIVSALSKIHAVAAGADFSIAVDEEGSVYTFGWTEFGKLGQGSDGCYNTKDSSIKLTYTAAGTPTRIGVDGLVVQASAGKNHAACVCDDGKAYSWGDGAYGKLGHRAQEQRNSPTRIQGARFRLVQCGDNSTCGLGWPESRYGDFVKPVNSPGMLFIWGVLKGTHGEGATHPMPEYELQGWSIPPTNLSMGASHLALASDDAAVAWAQTPVAYGQLGYGEKGPKSSHKPQKVQALDDCLATQVVANTCSTFYLLDKDHLPELPVWTPSEDNSSSKRATDDDDDQAPAPKKRKSSKKKK